MRLAWQLRRRHAAAPADAILLPSDSAADLLALCAELGPKSGAIYATERGLLMMLEGRSNSSFSRAIRLCP